MPVPTFLNASGMKKTEDLTGYLTYLIEEINNLLYMLDQDNISHMNYIPLLVDGETTSVTPTGGYIRSVTSSGVATLQYYDGTAWVTVVHL